MHSFRLIQSVFVATTRVLVPEPSGVTLILVGLIGFMVRKQRHLKIIFPPRN